MLPQVAFTGFASRYREPKVEEGFRDITKVDFKVNCEFEHIPVQPTVPTNKPQQFEGTEEQKMQWKKYWIS